MGRDGERRGKGKVREDVGGERKERRGRERGEGR